MSHSCHNKSVETFEAWLGQQIGAGSLFNLSFFRKYARAASCLRAVVKYQVKNRWTPTALVFDVSASLEYFSYSLSCLRLPAPEANYSMDAPRPESGCSNHSMNFTAGKELVQCAFGESLDERTGFCHGESSHAG